MTPGPARKDLLRNLFLTSEQQSLAAFCEAIASAANTVATASALRKQPVSGLSYDELRAVIEELHVCPETGVGLQAALMDVKKAILPHVVTVSDPNYVAHYHSPPMLPSLAAEVMIRNFLPSAVTSY